jgi:hypothetical protein
MIFDDGTEKICGCYDIKVETTNIENESASMQMTFNRYGPMSKRAKTHKKIAEIVKENK